VLPEEGRSVALVGSRRATCEGMALAQELARQLASRGVIVVSGGALGIDAAAHRGALDGGGRTVAVLGTGIDVVYPERHRALFDQIVAAGGALVSMFEAGALPLPGHFVARNAFIAGLAHAVIVVEAAARSGSLSTARFAQKQGKLVGAVAGSPGANQLLAGGALMVRSADDIFSALDSLEGIAAPQSTCVAAEPALEELPARVLAAIPPDDLIDEEALALASGLTPRLVVRALSSLELVGLVMMAPGRRYRRTASPSALPARGSRGQHPN
jgi:DNA processing protein